MTDKEWMLRAECPDKPMIEKRMSWPVKPTQDDAAGHLLAGMSGVVPATRRGANNVERLASYGYKLAEIKETMENAPGTRK